MIARVQSFKCRKHFRCVGTPQLARPGLRLGFQPAQAHYSRPLEDQRFAFEIEPTRTKRDDFRRTPPDVKPHHLKVAIPVGHGGQDACNLVGRKRIGAHAMAPAHPQPPARRAQHRIVNS